jgi:ATP/maltotriose-dependent transcriptional regulator MalT
MTIPENFKKIMPLLSVAQAGHQTVFSMTNNFPFFHKAQVDYTNINPEFDKFLEDSTENVEPIMGNVFKPLMSLIEAGLLYERNELAEAEKITIDIMQTAQHFPPEVQFSSMALYYEIMRVQGKTNNTENIRDMITETKSHYLLANFNALNTNKHLYKGDTDAANHWLSQSEIDNTLKLNKIYQYFTSARSLMVIGELSKAEALLEKLVHFSTEYRRPSNYIEALTLQSVCLWHMKNSADSIAAMTKAIQKAFELKLIMPIINEGDDILPIIQKILNRLKYGYDLEILDKNFANTLFFNAQKIARHRGKMIKSSKNKPIKLSSRQLEILRFLEKNFSYKEIGSELKIKVTTVDDHINKLYEKLEVTNARDAVMKAIELGILSKHN